MLRSAWLQCCIFMQLTSYIFETNAQSWLFGNCYYTKNNCPNSDISFWLYKNETQHNPLQLDPLNLNASDFTPKLPLVITIHGFTGSRELSPNMEIRPVLLQAKSVYLIAVDYAVLARLPCYYPWSVSNGNIVAKCLAQLIDNLQAAGISEREDIHVIGFSLGGQIAGLTANYVQNRLNWITGLDPARPGFMTDDLHEKLDSGDADFVDVIHTDPFFYAQLSPAGHADFYPNFELKNQAGCTFWDEKRGLRNCNHFRAPLYYAESISSQQGFWSYNCGDWMEFMLNRCSNYSHIPSAAMGFFVSKNASGSYFLSTHSVAPFAQGRLARELSHIERQINPESNENLPIEKHFEKNFAAIEK